MTTVERDTATPAHDTRRRTTRSPSRTRSSTTRASPAPTSKRSPSPIIAFQPTPLSAEHPKGVHNITRKVIKRLEGLGHLEMIEIDSPLPEEDESSSGQDEQVELEKMLYALGREAVESTEASGIGANGSANGHAKVTKKAKTDLEIPRKVLHSSIGMFNCACDLSST